VERDPTFPKSIMPGRHRLWALPELEAWERRQAAGDAMKTKKESPGAGPTARGASAEIPNGGGAEDRLNPGQGTADRPLKMSEAQSSAQVSAAIGALKEQYLLNKYVAASQAENNRYPRLHETPMVHIPQAFRLPGGGSQPSLGERSVSNPVKDAGMLLEALEHVNAYMRDKATRQEGGPPHSDFDRLDGS
jgi:hypothetical protein